MVLDCDPGLDDAVAIALALDHLDVAAITTVGGNVGIEMTTANALAVTELLGRADVPVHAGHDDPFGGRPIQRAAEIHGPNGMGRTRLPTPSRPMTSDDAVSAILEASHRHPGLWLVATGPLTNLAHAVEQDRTLLDRITGISWMGGSSTYGNVTSVAEFNAWADPEAVDAIFRCGAPRLLMHGLNVTHQVLLDEAWIAALAAEGNGPVANSFAELLEFYRQAQAEQSTLAGAAVHDALAVLSVSHPELFRSEPRDASCVLSGEARGMTIVDQRPRTTPAEPTIELVTDADADRIRSLIHATLTAARG